MITLKDSFGRTFPYIRLSITDVCNFKCGYCLPNGYMSDKSDNRKFLHLDEIRRLAKVFSKLGVNKIRLTGGSPPVSLILHTPNFDRTFARRLISSK